MRTSNETLQIIRFAQGASNALNGKEMLQSRLGSEAYVAGYETVKELMSDPGYDLEMLEGIIFEMLTTQKIF